MGEHLADLLRDLAVKGHVWLEFHTEMPESAIEHEAYDSYLEALDDFVSAREAFIALERDLTFGSADDFTTDDGEGQ